VIDYDKIKNKNLRIRSWLNGDWFQPLGMNGKKKISDYLIDNKIDCFKKENQLVLTADDDIIWLCGQRISDKVKVTNSTSNMMELSYNKFAQ
jgi:tRNA(Ile)-lysidine synthase